MLTDSFGRKLTYLRISLTDRCNFRCVYCMPPEGISLLPREEILSLDEIEHLARIFVSLGVNKIRLTGGEPLLRKRMVSLVAALAALDGLREVGLTTNGSFLAPLALSLKEAGLKTVNVSLDSLDRERFARITRRDELPEVILGITRAVEAQLTVKINVVAMNDLSHDEVLRFCNLTRSLPVEVRFLEFMPLCGTGWKPGLKLSMATLKSWVDDAFDLNPLPREGNVAETFQVANAPGRVGFIASMSEPFCGSCTRIRLTSTGCIRPCLFSNFETDLRTPMRSGASDEELENIIRRAVWGKPKGHEDFLGRMKNEDLPKIRMLGG